MLFSGGSDLPKEISSEDTLCLCAAYLGATEIEPDFCVSDDSLELVEIYKSTNSMYTTGTRESLSPAQSKTERFFEQPEGNASSIVFVTASESAEGRDSDSTVATEIGSTDVTELGEYAEALKFNAVGMAAKKAVRIESESAEDTYSDTRFE
ncbi:hypothetical protein AYI70_g3414 [Smittium culicis]|uniref:Uncharacterized protein n=1 Tax=Smittium culicis TaxID=133412 RepID=A0A1R1Y3L1_9FUNG|nr:hypothetical protein AYI70_g3414 [Smittium culicis]